jgi:hypothetical protein
LSDPFTTAVERSHLGLCHHPLVIRRADRQPQRGPMRMLHIKCQLTTAQLPQNVGSMVSDKPFEQLAHAQ